MEVDRYKIYMHLKRELKVDEKYSYDGDVVYLPHASKKRIERQLPQWQLLPLSHYMHLKRELKDTGICLHLYRPNCPCI